MELRNLATFLKIAELGNFTRTAETLGYTQSAVTMQIKQLEKELGAPLFERIGRKIRLTEAGERLLPYAIEASELIKSARQAVNRADDKGGKLRIGTGESYAISVLPRIFAALKEKFPKAEIEVATGDVTELLEKLKRNEVDAVYFLDRKIYLPEWVKAFEKPIRIHFTAAANDPLAKEKKIPLKRLVEEPWFLTEKGVNYRYAMEQILAKQGLAIHPFLEISNTGVITRFVAAGKGISFLPEYVIAPLVKEGTLAVLDADCPEIVMYGQLVCHRNKFATPLLTEFIRLASAES